MLFCKDVKYGLFCQGGKCIVARGRFRMSSEKKTRRRRYSGWPSLELLALTQHKRDALHSRMPDVWYHYEQSRALGVASLVVF